MLQSVRVAVPFETTLRPPPCEPREQSQGLQRGTGTLHAGSTRGETRVLPQRTHSGQHSIEVLEEASRNVQEARTHIPGVVLVDVATFQVSHATPRDVEATTLRTTRAKSGTPAECWNVTRVGSIWRENSLPTATQHTRAMVSIPSPVEVLEETSKCEHAHYGPCSHRCCNLPG